ncbi:hypothetical protein [Streptomyces sp. NPDC003006]
MIIAGAVVFVNGGGGFPEAEYRLTVRPELVDGAYKLTQDLSETTGRAIVEENRSRANVRDPKAVVAQYKGQGEQEGAVMVVSGMSGRFRDPAAARADVMEGATEGQGAVVAVPARDITPTGSDITVSCQVLTQEGGAGGVRSNVPICAWGDDNTAVGVGLITDANATQDPESVDLDELARTTLQVREEMREPIG